MGTPKRLTPAVIIAAVAGFLLFDYLDSGPGPRPQGETVQAPAIGQPSYGQTGSYALRAENTWPTLAGEAEGAPVAGRSFGG